MVSMLFFALTLQPAALVVDGLPDDAFWRVSRGTLTPRKPRSGFQGAGSPAGTAAFCVWRSCPRRAGESPRDPSAQSQWEKDPWSPPRWRPQRILLRIGAGKSRCYNPWGHTGSTAIRPTA